jgi:AbrB family looped-hinge helix DNA binding protein
MRGAVSEKGQITGPKRVRERLGIRPGTILDVRKETGRLVATKQRRASLIPYKDRWAYTPAAIASLKRALADVKAGRVFEVSAGALEIGRYPRRRRRVGRAR